LLASAIEAALQPARRPRPCGYRGVPDRAEPKGALSVERSIRKTINLIAAFPGREPGVDLRSARRSCHAAWPLSVPYLVFYTVRDEEIVVLRVRHGPREPIDPSRL
jgi:plasmid stabilization system protein ParE